MSKQTEPQKRLGIVVTGSSAEGVDVKLDQDVSVEDIVLGRYVTIQGEKRRFFGMITRVSLESSNPQVPVMPPDISDPFISKVISGTTTYGRIRVLPMLTVGVDAASLLEGPQPVKTVPTHFSPVFPASQQDVETVFGKEGGSQFHIGTPLDMETKVCLNLDDFVKRSNGVFGKTGTGKTFLTRLLLIGILQSRAAVNLVFDMHSEYGWEAMNEKGYRVKGLKQHFPSKIQVFTLDEESARRRKVSADSIVKIAYSEIEPEDMELLRQTLRLTEPAVQAAYQIAHKYGDRNWLETLFSPEVEQNEDFAKDLNIHESTYRNLRRGLETLRRFPFLVPGGEGNSVQRILESLDRDINVILEFGRFEDYTAYILVANLLSRRIYAKYREKVERALGEGLPKPHPLVITIEEAHRFLNPELCNQTIFGTIAREMRKYNVSLLIVDQRPSGIDPEIMSQLGTKIACLLDNEQDVDSVLAGVSGRSELKAVLARLENRQQALIFGHAVPMPVVVRTREYGSAESYKDLSTSEKMPSGKGKAADELWP